MPSRGEQLIAARNRYREKHRDAINARKRARYAANPTPQLEKAKRYRKQNRERVYAYNAAWQRNRNTRVRAEMLIAYGGKCACCGEAEPIFLDLDHINNDGAQHRRELGNSFQVLLQLKTLGWPTDRFQLLCCNCNQGKARNGGVCPHVKNRS